VKVRKAFYLLPAMALPLAFAAPASAATNGTYTVPLDSQLNHSGATGTAILDLEGTTLRVTIDSHGLVPNAPHAQHLHGDSSGKNFTCPTPAQQKQLDKDGNGHVSTTEAAAFYGPVDIALTTTGDTSPSSALAVDRFPKADANGDLHYSRTITLTPEQAKSFTNLHIVQHGVDYNGNGSYDGAAKSDLDPSLPAEATDPAVCGAIQVSQVKAAPRGGVETGVGGTQGPESLPLFFLAGAALTGSAGALWLRRRTATAGR
jgi:hypothetical protein